MYFLAKPNTKIQLLPWKRQTIQPGVWRILVEGDTDRPSIDVLLLKRHFTISICDTNNMSPKRRAADHIRLTKRQNNEGLGTYVASHATSNITRKIAATIMDLQDGHTAFIKSQTEGETYFLQKKREIFTSEITHVFSCELSTIPGKIIAAKVLRTYPSSVSINAMMWKQEVKILQMLNHINITKIYGYDARQLVIY
ncbi:hypothetical protein GGI35DRAFT_314936 [Trichoderma velutinum]